MEASDEAWLTFCRFLKANDASRIGQMIDAGFSPNSSHRKSGSTALEMAAKLGRPEILLLLLGAGADPNARIDLLERASGRTLGGRTALMHSVDPEIVTLLLAHGADPTIRDSSGLSAVEHFLLQKSRPLVRAMLPGLSNDELAAAEAFLESDDFKRVVDLSFNGDGFCALLSADIKAEHVNRIQGEQRGQP